MQPMTCLEEYMNSTFLQIYVFKNIYSRILNVVSKNVMSIISDELSCVTVPFKKLNNSYFEIVII